jgi:flavin-binding protein dodecin
MKNATLALVALLALAALALPAAAASRNDFKVIQNAVKREPAAASHRELQWFKVVIEDGRSHRAGLKITLPVGLIEALLSTADGRHFKVDDDRCEIDLKAVWRALKKAGPTALVEIRGDDGGVIKIWLE